MSKAEKKRVISTVSKDQKSSQYSIESDPQSPSGSDSIEVSSSGSSGDDDDKLNKYYKISKKMAKEKGALKRKLDKLSSRYKQREMEFKVELDRSQAYLKDQLEAVCEERENLKKNFARDRENLKKKLTEKLAKHKDYLKKKYEKDTQEMKAMCENMTVSLKKKIKQHTEEREQIQKTLRERENFILALRSAKGEDETKIKKLEIDRENMILKIKNDAEKAKIEHSKQLEGAVKNKAEEIKRDFERRFSDHTKASQIQLDTMKKDYEKKMETVIYDAERKVEALSGELQRKTEILQRTEATTKSSLATKDKEVSNIKLNADKRIGELEDVCKKMQEQLGMYQAQNKKLQENLALTSSQSVNAFAKQKEIAEREIFDRDRVIESLERQLRGIGQESVDRFNTLERKLSSTTTNLNELMVKYSEKEKEFQKLAEEHTRLLNQEHKNKDVISKNSEAIGRLKADLGTKIQEIALKDRQLTTLQGTIDGLHQTLQKAEARCKEMDATNEKLEKQIRNLKNEMEICNRTVSLNKDEYTRMLNTLEKEHKHTLSLSDSEKTREIQSLTDKIEQLNIVIASQRTNLDTMTKSLTTVNSECVKLREIVAQQGDAVEHIKKKDIELQSMRLEYNRMKANLATGLNLNAKGHTEREKELADLRAKLKDTESKDVQLRVLKDQLSNVQQYYGQKISKLEEDNKKDKEEYNANLASIQEKHKKEMDALNKTIVELQIQNAKYAVKLEYEKPEKK